MNTLEFKILGNIHRISCEKGEEKRLMGLAERFNNKSLELLQKMKTADQKLIYFVTALTLLDEAEEKNAGKINTLDKDFLKKIADKVSAISSDVDS